MITVPEVARPEISIAMVLFRGGRSAVRALEIAAERTSLPYELIVIDNDSPDASGALVRLQLRGATFRLNAGNEGFGGAMNQAVALARAPYVALLNPDAEVEPGWDRALAGALDAHPDCAAVSALLLDPDGSVQEAGAVVDELGNTIAIGSAELPARHEDLVAREIDYASAAALMVRKRAFVAVGGFDPRYHPAYFEDVDLAFRLRDAGWTLRLEPAARVVHAGGATDLGRAAMRLADTNKQKFRARWEQELQRRARRLAGLERSEALRSLP